MTSVTASVDFTGLADVLESDAAIRESIRDATRDLELPVKTMLASLNAIHSSSSHESIVERARSQIPEIVTRLAKLVSLIPSQQFWRFHESFNRTIQSICFGLCLIVYLESESLATKSEVETVLGLRKDQQDRFSLSTEDYLHGVISMVNELSRLAVNSVTMQAYQTPVKISLFLKELSAGFSLLNLKNDSLRKRTDSIKYDLKKTEEVVYDLTLRNLCGPASESAADSSRKRARSNEAQINGKREDDMNMAMAS
ncbi:uncharacterized protein L969DRAFT_168385 [Mixia osmundae IAM 14324]|uniref:Translin n=1 Tax=Mixia osmundae (strain CBS 9802 / IAM 14324 / JCM 22182 / KY 12970) TaxID=764103 RepID=G7E7C8_MIXOS|nr:uncharacterized protein L969DRAFT_168385 [Mixia osmundae IAM 14324]KEI42705.1 hypothetical protein L969DRAFT_168385 [Mixia osmundae IAM 14324]GAA98738.1 hypothetical protein E5Q_05426 [Mixia osmundae IAM 14324]